MGSTGEHRECGEPVLFSQDFLLLEGFYFALSLLSLDSFSWGYLTSNWFMKHLCLEKHIVCFTQG